MGQVKRFLFVAAGPTAQEAKRFLRYGPLVTMNWALELFDKVDIACFGSPNKARTTREHWHRAKLLVPLFPQGKADKLGMPAEKTTCFHIPEPPREPEKNFRFLREYIRAGNVLGRATKVLHFMRKAGYGEVWLFGHDGGTFYHPALGQERLTRRHDKDRFVVEETLKHLGFAYKFWPSIPDGWL